MAAFLYCFDDIETILLSLIGKSDFYTTDDGYLMHKAVKPLLPKIVNMEVRKDDIWLLGNAKSGNTWVSELIWTLMNNADIEAAKKLKHQDRWCFPELQAYENMVASKKGIAEPEPDRDRFEETVNCKSPRLIRTHMYLGLLPPNLLDTSKVVYIARDPKDIIVSFFHFTKGVFYLPISIQTYFQAVSLNNGLLDAGGAHVKEAWDQKHHPNMYFLFYEDMIKDLPGVIRKMATFLDKPINDEQVEKLTEHLSFKSMKNNSMINMDEVKDKGLIMKNTQFIRKGIAGDWKNHFTPSMIEKFNERWKLLDCDIKFPEV